MAAGTPAVLSRAGARGPVRTAALVFGLVFLIFGVAGFIPVLTADLSSIRGADGQSEAMLFEALQISVINNVVYLVYGIAGIVMAVSSLAATLYLLGGGVVLWLYALAVPHQSVASFVPMNPGDDLLHFLMGATMVCVAFVLQLVRRGEGQARRGTSSS